MGAIYLVRHGQASFGAADYDALSPRGFEQSTVVGTELLRRNVSFSQVRSGSLAQYAHARCRKCPPSVNT